ncbi:glycosyl hydrolase family 5 [Fibrobacter sp. UBA4309]|uniref:glycosyl hydrolase family 5 n=1 Tax=Fibrobacter sp. UBA4309 TaxID=1946537 RepID=UPI0025BA8D7A|nr:glycosyl hydrolase family 5 [Fibrobacter sp. UBA4309]
MKMSFLKSVFLAMAALGAWSCSDSITAEDPAPTPAFKVCPEAGENGAYHLQGGMDILIYPDLVVTNGEGTVVGSFLITNGTIGSIIGTDGRNLIQNVDLAGLTVEPVNTPAIVITGPSWYLKDGTGEYVIKNDEFGTVTDIMGNTIGVANLTALPTITIYSPDGKLMTSGSTENMKIYNIGARCTVTPIESSSSVEPESSNGGEINPGTSSSSGGNNNSSARQSSSSVKSNSSVQSSSSKTGQCPTIKQKGGASGSGWATRYWDCCKPHCSWPEHANGNYSRQCTNKGKTQDTNYGGNKSICDGQGSAMTCTSQIPFTIDGCTDMGFAFAAVPASNGGACGKCFQLTFTGKGKYGDNQNTAAIKNKKLIIMVTNVGTDVEQGQFDIMIPGGGVGIFNGCSSMGWGSQGEQYGGLLSDCERESDYKAGATLTCLKNKCNSVFSNDAEAKKGCLFLADYMHAAGNPMHNYVEVECPDVLKQKY